MIKFPTDWYWRAADGRIYASRSQTIVAGGDAGYVAFVEAGHVATPWPKDDNGGQTTASLQTALDALGLYVDLAAYAAARRYAMEVAGATISGHGYGTDRESRANYTGAVLAAQLNPSATFNWKTTDGSFVTLDAAGVVAVATGVMAHVQSAFDIERTALAGITASPPTITTQAQIDALFA